MSTQLRSGKVGDDARRPRWPETSEAGGYSKKGFLVPYRPPTALWGGWAAIKDEGGGREEAHSPANLR